MPYGIFIKNKPMLGNTSSPSISDQHALKQFTKRFEVKKNGVLILGFVCALRDLLRIALPFFKNGEKIGAL
jgi:hypothetical protein